MSCPRPKCPVETVFIEVDTVFIEVDENIDCLPMQAPLKCSRCGSMLEWQGWTHDPR